ncbi:MAG: hypothetical protein WCI05_11110, partial [Myxococcales bacterium]
IGLPTVVHRPGDCGPSACRLWSIGLPTVVHRPGDCGPSAWRLWSIGLPSVVEEARNCGTNGSAPPRSKTILLARMGKEDVEGEGGGG